MIYFSFDKIRAYKRKEEHGYHKSCEANQGSNDSSLNKIMIKSQQIFSLNQKQKEVFLKLTKNKSKSQKQSFLFSLINTEKRSNSTNLQEILLKIKTNHTSS